LGCLSPYPLDSSSLAQINPAMQLLFRIPFSQYHAGFSIIGRVSKRIRAQGDRCSFEGTGNHKEMDLCLF